MKKIFTSISLLMALSATSYAQQATQYSLYMWNKFAFNPAYAGMDNSLSVTGVFRNQWEGLPGAPQTRGLNAHLPLYIAGGGAGIGLVNETIGSWTETTVTAAYNYQMEMGNTGVLSLGLGAGFIQRELDGAKIRTPEGTYSENPNAIIQHNDPILPDGVAKETGAAPTVHAGAFYQSEKLDIGVSAMNLLNNELSFSNISYKPERTYYFYAGYRLELSKKISIEPSALIKSTFDQTQMDFSVLLKYNENIFGGASFRGYNSDSNDAMVLIAGLKLSEKISFGYAYDLTLSNLNTVSNGSHELILNYNLGKPIGKGKPPIIIYNPRSL